MAALSSGHLATDFANGALPALLPFFVDKFDLSYTLAATAVLVSAVSSSIVQPLFGLWSDRRGALWLLPAGVALAGSGIALASVAPTYPLVLLCVVVSGLAGGTLLAVPCLVVAAVLLALVPFLGSFAPERGQRVRSDEPDRIGALMLLLSVIAFRSVAWFGLITFVPLWEVSLGHSKAHGNHLLSLMLLAGGIGTLAAGPLADRFGRRPVLIASLAATGPLILAYVLAGGAVGAVALALVGVCVIGTFGVTMVMSQEYLPRRIGMASGLSIGLSIGLGGIAAVALGAIADAIDLRSAMYAAAAAAVPGFVLAALLPASRARRPVAAEAAAPGGKLRAR